MVITRKMKLGALLLTGVTFASALHPPRAIADLESEYNRRSNRPVTAWFLANEAQFKGKDAIFGGNIVFYIEDNGDLFKYRVNIFHPIGKPATLKDIVSTKIGNILRTNRSTSNTCSNHHSLGCASANNTFVHEVEYAIRDCKLYKYIRSRRLSEDYFGPVERVKLGTCQKSWDHFKDPANVGIFMDNLRNMNK